MLRELGENFKTRKSARGRKRTGGRGGKWGRLKSFSQTATAPTYPLRLLCWEAKPNPSTKTKTHFLPKLDPKPRIEIHILPINITLTFFFQIYILVLLGQKAFTPNFPHITSGSTCVNQTVNNTKPKSPSPREEEGKEREKRTRKGLNVSFHNLIYDTFWLNVEAFLMLCL